MLAKVLTLLLLITTTAQAETELQIVAQTEQRYLSFLEAQNRFWQEERATKSAASIRGAAADYEGARMQLETSRQSLDAFLSSIQKQYPKVVARLQAARNNWFTQKNEAADQDYLQQLRIRFADHKAALLAPLEWQAIRDVYGKNVEEQLVSEAFAVKTWPTAPNTVVPSESVRVVWVNDPYANLSADLHAKAFDELATISEKSLTQKDLEPIIQSGVTVDQLYVSDYETLESQSAELFRQLQVKYLAQDSSTRILLLSSGQGSAIVYELLDRYPELRQEEKIAGWVNWNGLLYGMPMRESLYQKTAQRIQKHNTRALASVATPWELTPAQKFYDELTQAQMQRQQKILPLGPGFKIWSFIPAVSEARANPELREAIIADGETWLWEKQQKPASVLSSLLENISSGEFAAN